MCLREQFSDWFERSKQQMESYVQKIRRLQQQGIAKMLLNHWAYHIIPRFMEMETILIVCLLMTDDHLCSSTAAHTLVALNTFPFVGGH